MASYNRRMRRAMAQGKDPQSITFKTKPHGGRPQLYDVRDNTREPGIYPTQRKKGGKV